MITCATFSDAMSSDLARDHIGANTAFDSRLSADSIGGSGASAVTWTPCVCVNVHPCTPHMFRARGGSMVRLRRELKDAPRVGAEEVG